jgi:hypothetical protein
VLVIPVSVQNYNEGLDSIGKRRQISKFYIYFTGCNGNGEVKKIERKIVVNGT